MNEFPKGVEVVCGAIIEHKGKILMTCSPKWKNKWMFPGGHIEPGETILDSAARDVAEEMGVVVKPVAIISYGELINSKDFHRPGHFIYFDVLCELISGEVKIEDPELSKCKWVTTHEALTMDLAETYEKTIKDYMEYKSNG